jgi:hypothetical protein
MPEHFLVVQARIPFNINGLLLRPSRQFALPTPFSKTHPTLGNLELVLPGIVRGVRAL